MNELVTRLIDRIKEQEAFSSKKKITVLDIGTAPKSFGSPTAERTLKLFKDSFPDKEIELRAVDIQFPDTFTFDDDGVYIDERTGIHYMNRDIRDGPLESADVVIAVNLLDLYKKPDERERIRQNIFTSGKSYVVTGVESKEDIHRLSSESVWEKIDTVYLMEDWYARFVYSRLGIDPDKIGEENLKLRSDLSVNYAYVEPILRLLDEVEESKYQNLFRSLAAMFLRGELAPFLGVGEEAPISKIEYLKQYFSDQQDLRVIEQFLSFIYDYLHDNNLKNEITTNSEAIIPLFYELVNLFILYRFENGEIKKSGERVKMLFIQARAEPFGHVPGHLPLALPTLTASLMDGTYQARLFSRLRMSPEIFEHYLTVEKEIKAIDFQIKDEDFDYEAYLREYRPDIVGIRTVSVSINEAERVAKVTREALKDDVKIHFGGYHITALPKETMERNKGIVDIGFLQEAEETYPQFLARYFYGEKLPLIPGIAYFDESGEFRKTEPRRVVMDIDDYPSFLDYLDVVPDLNKYAILTQENVHGTITSKAGLLVTERGCLGRCAFCPTHIMFTRAGIRFTSPENVIEKMQVYYDKGYRIFIFRDDNFTGNKERIRKFADMIIERGWKIAWMCMSRADTVDEDLLRKMYQSGLSGIAFGVESGSERILQSMKKKLRLLSVRKANALCRKLGITYKNYYMVGSPGETWKDVLRSMLFMSDSLIGFKDIDDQLSSGQLNGDDYIDIFESFIDKLLDNGSDLKSFLARNLSFPNDVEGSVNVAYAMPYPGSEWYKLLGKEMWMNSEMFRHGPPERANLDEFEAPIYTREMTSDDLTEARLMMIDYYDALKKKDIESVREILAKVIDKAMLSSSPTVNNAERDKEVGGIDFNPRNLDLRVDGDDFDMLMPTRLQLLHGDTIRGFSPVIINITPITNINMFLGEAEENEYIPLLISMN